MAFDAGLAHVLRTDLADEPGIAEKRMFGGLAFLRDGHMVCGVHTGGAMFRVGKPAEAEALALPGVTPMAFTGRRMGGMVEATDDATRARLLDLALSHARSLPKKA